MSDLLIPTHCFIGATAFLAGSVAVRLLGVRWRLVERGLLVLTLLGAVCGLALSAISRASWPLVVAEEVILASAAGAVLWRLLLGRRRESVPEASILCTIGASLLVWGLGQRSGSQVRSAVNSLQSTWLFATRLVVALACGAFVDEGGLALSCLVAAGQGHGRSDVDCIENTGRYAVLLGFPLLTVSLLLAALGGLYSEGVYWRWSVAESWQLLTWLYYAVVWCGYVLLGWRSRRLWILASLGVILTALMLKALVSVP